MEGSRKGILIVLGGLVFYDYKRIHACRGCAEALRGDASQRHEYVIPEVHQDRTILHIEDGALALKSFCTE